MIRPNELYNAISQQHLDSCRMKKHYVHVHKNTIQL